LIVDDHDGFRRFVRDPLEAAGFTVAEAATGAEATEAARTVRPGLVLLDIQLPDFDRFEVARRLAADPAGGSAPVVMLTSTREASDYGGRIAASPAAGSCPRISCRRCAAPVPGPGAVQNCQFWSRLAGWPALGAGDRVRVSGSGPASRGLRLRWCERRRCG
jgi:CheY-like chemotaxis protein